MPAPDAVALLDHVLTRLVLECRIPVVMIAGINLIHRQTTFSEDTGIGLLFVGMLALGVIFISRTASYTGSLTSILFGDALGHVPPIVGADLHVFVR